MKQKSLIGFTILACLFGFVNAQKIEITGSVFLDGESNHENIKVIFIREAPSFLTDTTLSNNTGFYSINIEQGVYKIKFQKEQYLSDSTTGKALYTNSTISNVTLYKSGLFGELKGVLHKGEYNITGDILVSSFDTLIIEAGTTLKFGVGVNFNINGMVTASGTKSDSIIFKSLGDKDYWGGINIINSNHKNNFSYSIIKSANSTGIYADNSTLEISNSVFRNNIASAGQLHGPALRVINNSNIKCFNSYFYDNNGNNNYSISIYIENSNGEFDNLVFANNFGGYSCLRIENSVVKVSNVTIFNDFDKFPGVSGIQCFNSTGYVRNSIAVGGYTGFSKNNDNFKIEYCDAWNNRYKNFEDDNNSWFGVKVTINSNNDSIDAWNNIQLNPNFIMTTSNNFSLTENSPCIDAGTNDSIDFDLDILGNQRICDGNNDGIAIVDMGAYEYPNFTSVNRTSIDNDFYTIFPNPANEYLDVKGIGEGTLIQVYDIYGRLQLSENYSGHKIDIRKLSSGLNYILIRENDHVANLKVLKY